jgi:hypothetical protein
MELTTIVYDVYKNECSAPGDERSRTQTMSEPRTGRTAKFVALGLWLLLGALFVIWTLLLWHPWIDWFGRPR